MRRILIPLTLACTLAFAACGDDKSADSTTASTAAAGSTSAAPTSIASTTGALPSSSTASTSAATASTAGSGASGAVADAAGQAWSVAFDSNVGFDEKSKYIEDAEALRPTIEAYTQAGSAMGGITLAPTNVVVDGTTATVTYDVMFGTRSAYQGQTGTISLVDGNWVVARADFCSFMASARNACPA